MGKLNFLAISISALLLLSNLLASRADVITLTVDTFSDKLQAVFLDLDEVTHTNPCSLRYQEVGIKGILNPEAHKQCHEIIAVLCATELIKEKDTAWFVLFGVPWCKHCKNLGSLWEDFGKTMEGEDEIEVGQVDCSVSKPVCSKVGIHSYPTFKLFYNGEEVAKYQGTRDVESLKAFAVEETEKAAAKALEDDDKDL